MNLFAAIGRIVLGFLAETGRLGIFMAEAVSDCVRPPIYGR